MSGRGDKVAGPFEGHSEAVVSVAFSPDGRRTAAGSRDSTSRVWDTKTGKVVAGPFEGHDNAVNSINFSLDGLRL